MANDSREIAGRFRNYRLLGQELARRSREPAAHPSFVIFFVLTVVGFGGLGFWWELYAYAAKPSTPGGVDPLRTALMTLLPALVGSTALQAILAESRRDFRAFAFLALVALSLIALLIGPSSAVGNCWAFIMGIPAWVLAAWIWWITNADQPSLKDGINLNAAIGGDNPNAALSGDLDGFNH